MTIYQLLAFNLALFAALLSPGPAFLMCISTSLSSGHAAGMRLGLGLAIIASMWTGAALFGLEQIFTSFPFIYIAVKIAGALYLIHIAVQMWRGARKPINAKDEAAQNAFRRGVITNLLNPKSVLFAASVLVVVFPRELLIFEKAFIIANHLLVEILFYGALSFFISRPALTRQYLRAKPGIDRVCAFILGGLGLRLIFDQEN